MTLTPKAERFVEEWNSPKPYVVAHTSGSTGVPKEIRLLKTDMLRSARATIKFFNLDSSSLLFLPLSPDYIAGKMQIVRALEAGCSLLCEPPSSSLTIPKIDRPISLLPVVPAQVTSVLKAVAEGRISNNMHSGFSKRGTRISNIIIGGAPLRPELEEEVLASGLNAYATYGMTETCSHVALRPLGSSRFKAVPGFSFSTDERGCLAVHAPEMSFGTVTTNDLVELHDSTTFIWKGRYDNIINSGGLKISPEEIEKEIAPLFDRGVNFYATSRHSRKWGEELVIVCDSYTPSTDLLQRFRDLLGSKRSPKAIIIDPEMRFTDSKKIIRRKF